jgi:hypothetical protein
LNYTKEIEIPGPDVERSENLLEDIVSEYLSSDIEHSKCVVDVVAGNIEIESLEP